MSNQLVLKPRLSEKTYALSQNRVYVFVVPKDANKLTVRQAVQDQFSVVVSQVRMTNVKGKVKNTVRKGGRRIVGRRSDIKKAYVTLQEGDQIPVFAAVEEAQANAEKEKK